MHAVGHYTKLDSDNLALIAKKWADEAHVLPHESKFAFFRKVTKFFARCENAKVIEQLWQQASISIAKIAQEMHEHGANTHELMLSLFQLQREAKGEIPELPRSISPAIVLGPNNCYCVVSQDSIQQHRLDLSHVPAAFLYLQGDSSCYANITKENYQAVLQVAEDFNFDGLIEACLNYSPIHFENLDTCLTRAQKAPKFGQRVAQFLLDNRDKTLKKEYFETHFLPFITCDFLAPFLEAYAKTTLSAAYRFHSPLPAYCHGKTLFITIDDQLEAYSILTYIESELKILPYFNTVHCSHRLVADLVTRRVAVSVKVLSA